jgi:beta-glucanase (GH16 family)
MKMPFKYCLFLVVISVFACKKNKEYSSGKLILPEEEPIISKPGTPIPAFYEGYDLIWNDEFNANSLNLNYWNYEIGTGINGDFGTGQLDRATDRNKNANILQGVNDADGGALTITTYKEFYLDREYTSGRINTKGNFTAGPGTRIEARIWPRDVKYKGQGFAFWMMPAEIPEGQTSLMWPQGGEIDIMEYVGAIPYHNLGTVHYAWSWENNQWQSWNHVMKGAYYNYQMKEVPNQNPVYGSWPVNSKELNAGSSGFHIYRIDWFDNRIEFSVDGQIYHINYFNDGNINQVNPDGDDQEVIRVIDGKRIMLSEYSHHFNEWKPFSHQFYLILSAGVGGNDQQTYGGSIVPQAIFPCSVFIDWVRVYQRK